MSSYRAYELIEELGKGSYGSVTKNRHILTGDAVAIKCFVTDTKDFATVRKSVLMESTALREVRHENIVRLFHVFMEDSTFYMVFEFVDKTLLGTIHETPKKQLGCGERTRSFCFQLLRALAFVHTLQYVHRDVKPENILISHHNILKLCDFGFAIKKSYIGQRYSTYIATRWYRAPELLTGDFFYGRGVDIWAAGAVIVEMILGQPMAAGADDTEQMAKTIDLVGELPKYMRDRTGRSDRPTHEAASPAFAGLDTLFLGQPELYLSFIKSCLEPDPQLRVTADALLLHPLFTYDGHHYPTSIITEVRQNAVMNGRDSAYGYQAFLRKCDLYHRAARELLQNPVNATGPAAMSRYRQLGMSEQVIRQMADMVCRDKRYPPDFLTQSPELYQFNIANVQGDSKAVRSSPVFNLPKLDMYFTSPFAKSGIVKREKSVPAPGIGWRKPEPQPADTLRSQPTNPWNSFNVQKTFPGTATPQRTIKLQLLVASKRCSLKELTNPAGSASDPSRSGTAVTGKTVSWGQGTSSVCFDGKVLQRRTSVGVAAQQPPSLQTVPTMGGEGDG